jgi:micrococcal nuclease
LACNVFAAEKFYGNARISKIIKVYDGDTFYADIEGWHDIVGKRIGIRITGIDTSKIRTKCNNEKQLSRTARRLA